MKARFWRNLALIAAGHVALLVLLLRWAGETRAASAPQITWLSGADAEPDKSVEMPEVIASTPEPADTPPGKSEITLPNPVPKPALRPLASPKPTPRKKAMPKASETPAKKKVDKKELAAKIGGPKKPAAGSAKALKSGNGGGASGTGSGKGDAATASYYGNMLHDRFYRAWEQPQTVVASGAKLCALARIRIEKDGRVSDFRVLNPSGNVLVDESVQAISRKVTQVDALPAGMGSGGHYDVNINFALNSK
jgi:TonB family protein